MPKPKKQTSKSAEEYEKLGRMLESLYETGYVDHKTAYKMMFIKGVLMGLGGVLGATLVVGVLLWVLTLFNEVPLIGPFLQNVHNTVESNNR